MTRVSKVVRVHRLRAGGGILSLGLLSLVSLPAQASAASAFVMPDPTSSVYRSFVAVGGANLQVQQSCSLTGNLQSNGPLSLGQGDKVTGNVSAVGQVSNQGTVSGTVTSGAPAKTLPVLPTQAQAQALANRVFTTNTTFNNANIDDVVFVEGDVHIQGSLDGSGTLIVLHDLTFDGTDSAHPIPLAATTRLSILALHDIHLGQLRPLRGLLYAGHDADLQSQSTFHGVVIAAHNLTIEQSAQLAFLELDTTPPVISSLAPANGSLLATATPILSAAFADDLSGVDPASVQLLLDGANRTSAAQVTAAGFTFTPSAPLPDGTHAAALSVRDLAGNPAQAAWSFTTDVTPPSLLITSPPSATVKTASPTLAVSYSDATSGADLASLHIVLDGAALTSTCQVAAAAATCTPAPLKAGPHTLAASLRDRAGNQASASLAFQVLLDTTPPSISGLMPADGSIVNVPLPTCYALFSDPDSGIDLASVHLVLDGVDQTAAATITPSTILFTPAAALAQGKHTFTLTVKDPAGNQAGLSSTFMLDTVPPTLNLDLPQIAEGDPPPAQVQVSYADATSGVVLASFKLSLDGTDMTSGCTLGPSSGVCTLPPALYGLHQVSALIADKAGNQASVSSGFDDEPPAPALDLTAPAAGSLVNTPSLRVQGTVAGRGGAAVTGVTVNGVPATVSGGSFTATVPLGEGGNALTAIAIDDGGRAATAYSAVVLDTRSPLLVLTTPADGQIFDTASAEVAGAASDENGLAELTLNGIPISLDGYQFDLQYPLVPGRNPLVLRAVDNAGNATTVNAVVNRFTPPGVTITSPPDLGYLASTTVDVTGTVSDPAAIVTVNGVPATLRANSFLAAGIPLIEGGNTLTAVAATPGGVATTSVSVVRDLTPPHLAIDVPAAGAALFTPTVTVEGLVNDVVAGTVNAPQVTVHVNGVAAAVANRSFVAPDLPVAPGDNVITVVATDVSGNAAQASITVTRQPPSVAHLESTAGDHQQATVGSPLAQPLVVTLLDAAGAPIAGKPVVFQLRSNNGQLDAGKRAVVVTTDAAGHAAAHFTLGTRAGAGGQLVDAAAVGFAGAPVFTETALAGPPAALVLDSGDQQVGIAGGTLAHPFVAVVTDAGHNRLAGVSVTFSVSRGAGTFGSGQQQLAVTSDTDGRAIARFTLDPNEGIANNVAIAQIAGNASSPIVTFTASGRAAGDPAATSISGVVLDNTGQPVPGVTARILDSSLTAQTDGNGLFRLAPAPVGAVKLVVDGSTSVRPGSWPDLEFELNTVPGRDNTVNMPIYLLPLDLGNGKMVDETHGATLTSPAVPGFSLEIAPGSVTFPGGVRSGVVSVTLVHNDKVPMVPNFGQQPRLIVTIQPAGARFDPPARMTMPNLEGLAPGEVTEFYSFDHDLGHFVSIGPATVSDDGSLVRSNPGVGIVKGGWHCSGNPAAAGTAADCPPCYICNGSECVPGCPVSNRAATPPPAAAPGGDAAGFAAFMAAAPRQAASRAAPRWPADATAAAACNCHDTDCRVNTHCTDTGCAGTDVVVDSVNGPCFAAENTPVTFTAAANVPDHVKWTSSGTPSSGKGASFVTQFPAGLGQMVTAACTNAVSRRIDVLHACQDPVFNVLPLDPTDPALALDPGAFGVTRALIFVNKLGPCAKDGKECITGQFSFKVGSHVVDSFLTKKDVADNVNDPHITAGTCADIISDFTPTVPDEGPPRHQYWSREITLRHEAKHAEDLKSIVIDPTISDIKAYLAGLCSGCGTSPPSPDAVIAQINAFFNTHIAEYNPDSELRAHAVSNQLYLDLISAIRQRARNEQWPQACQ